MTMQRGNTPLQDALGADEPGDAIAAEQLWGALGRARDDESPRRLAQVEDALFRHYLPIARSMAAQDDGGNPDELNQAAEVGLAQAILAWRHRGSSGFDRFARASIAAQLDQRRTR